MSPGIGTGGFCRLGQNRYRLEFRADIDQSLRAIKRHISAGWREPAVGGDRTYRREVTGLRRLKKLVAEMTRVALNGYFGQLYINGSTSAWVNEVIAGVVRKHEYSQRIVVMPEETDAQYRARLEETARLRKLPGCNAASRWRLWHLQQRLGITDPVFDKLHYKRLR